MLILSSKEELKTIDLIYYLKESTSFCIFVKLIQFYNIILKSLSQKWCLVLADELIRSRVDFVAGLILIGNK